MFLNPMFLKKKKIKDKLFKIKENLFIKLENATKLVLLS